jgi:nucleotide sugar dehydrogenase
MRIAIVGTGYVGLVAGACFAENGNDVICIDIDEKKIKILQNAGISIYEPGLNKIVLNNVVNGNLKFTTNIKSSVENSDIIFIAVGTPPSYDGSPDLKYVLTVAKDIGKYMNEYKVIVNKSTAQVGTSDNISNIIENELNKRNVVIDFDVVSNPEFLREGNGIKDFMEPDRVIIGYANDKAKDIMKKLYLNIVQQDKIIYMSNKSAEMTKYASNAMLATRISFINDISNLCDILGVNVEDVKQGMGSDERIGGLFLNSGIGYGGSCFPKDIKALIEMANKNQYNMLLLKAVEEVNKNQKEIFIKKIIKYFETFNESLSGKIFAVWGLAFKEETDDMRESPAIVIINKLLDMGAKIICYDPQAIKQAYKIFGDKVVYGADKYSILKDADALLILNEWKEFKEADFNIINFNLKNKVIFDGRNVYNLKDMLSEKFNYISMGREPIYNYRQKSIIV